MRGREHKIVILLLFLLSLFMKPTPASEVRCIERERQSLLKFKQGLIDGPDILGTWGSEEDKKECCEWEHVNCSNTTGHVIRLDLAYQLKGGKISPELLELRHLNYLDLSGSNLRVDSLVWLSHLSSLKYLGLSSVYLGETNNWLQPITKLSSLEELHLSGCQLTNHLPAFDIFVNSSLSSLSFIDLSFNNLTSFSIFPSVFNLSTRLTHIDLTFNLLDGPIPDSFGQLNFLEVLRLNKNMLHGIPKLMGNLSHLRILDVSNNALNESLPHLLQKLSGIASKSLELIDLSYNQLVDSFPDITQFSSLKVLRLTYNQLNEFHPQKLGQPSSLETLDLSFNKLGGSLPDLRVYSSLQELSLCGNQLKGLDEGIWQLSKLQKLVLSSNSLEGTITEDHLSNLANLDYLDLSYNSLALNMSSDWIPPFQLIALYLRFCNVGPDFPKWLQTQEELSSLDLSFASISDTLPTWFWNSPSLLSLNLSYNHISGEVPDQFSSSLGFYSPVDLSCNNFSGPIPLSLFHSNDLRLSRNMFSGSISDLCTISSQSKAQVLDLSDNQLTGVLPDCWMNSSSLLVLNLANNKFSGQIPLSLGSNTRLQILHLRNNSFIGELPSSLKNCTGLRMLDVGENNLTGIIPQWIGTDLTSLTVLSIRFNKFHGNIPPTICHLTDIQILDLSRNNILGKIPECFNNSTSFVQKGYVTEITVGFDQLITYHTQLIFDPYVDNILVQWKGRESEYRKLGLLKGIDFSSNKLVGTIPHGFSEMRGLVFLNLSRNNLTGNIIPSIGQMEMLEWLDLSRNELSGKIPNSLAELHFLSVLDLSYNNLTGMIPLGTQLQSFNSSVYAGNNQLCGLPLAECPKYSPYPDHGHGSNVEEDDGEFISREFYICMTFGFIIGFWAVLVTLVLKHSWRHSFFNFWNKIGDWMYVTTMVYKARLKRKFLA